MWEGKVLKLGRLLALTFLMIAVSVSGCLCCCNCPATKPTPVDSIIGHWEHSESQGLAAIDFFPDGTVSSYEEYNGQKFPGLSSTWIKINDTHYKINGFDNGGKLVLPMNVFLNKEKTRLYLGDSQTYMVKK